MNSASIFCLFLVLVCVVSLETKIDENGCVWSYKCCEFKEINGNVTCFRLCEPEINCEPTETPDDQNQTEVVEEPIFQKPAAFAFSMNANHICRKGFRLDSKGICKRVFGAPVEKTTPANNDS